jgi:hypothetical protein
MAKMPLKKWMSVCCLCVVFVLVAVVVVMNFLGKHSIEPLVPCNGVSKGSPCNLTGKYDGSSYGTCQPNGSSSDLTCVM